MNVVVAVESESGRILAYEVPRQCSVGLAKIFAKRFPDDEISIHFCKTGILLKWVRGPIFERYKKTAVPWTLADMENGR